MNIKGFKIVDGKLVKKQVRKSVSQKIAERKRPKQRYVSRSKLTVVKGG